MGSTAAESATHDGQLWQFWIDVGGTFTDCYALKPNGALERHKLLSSGATTGSAIGTGRRGELRDVARTKDPEGFWTGYTLRVLGEPSEAGFLVIDFDASTGTLRLDRPYNPPSAQPTMYELSSDEIAPLIAVRYLLGLRRDAPIPPIQVRLGTTRGTNALVTRSGARTALVTTRGFGDVLRIGYQNRPKLFELDIQKPAPLFELSCEVEERVSADGTVLNPLNLQHALEQLLEINRQGIKSLAVCLLHGFAFPEHERQLAALAAEIGFDEISASHQVAPLMKIVARGDTTVVDAYLNPVLRSYLAQLRSALPAGDVRLLTSAGGLVRSVNFTGKDSILSGPAGGVVGFSRVAEAAGFERAIGFDMGGTSTDVSRFDGRHELEYETEKAGVRVVAPMMAIETVAAGGGSICKFDGVKLVVGPESAGAYPGPACYGRGGPLTITDVNLLLGKIVPSRFPFPLDRTASKMRATELLREMKRSVSTDYTVEQLADGLARIANARMAKAIRSISIAKGYDPRDYALVAFGGAAGQHACAVARELGIQQVLIHPDAGLLSAYGIGMASIERHAARGVYLAYGDEIDARLDEVFRELSAEISDLLAAEHVSLAPVHMTRKLEMRYWNTEAALPVELTASYRDATAAFEREHERLYGYRRENAAVEIVAARVTARLAPAHSLPRSMVIEERLRHPNASQQIYFDGQFMEAQLFERPELSPGDTLIGPSIVCEDGSTTVIDPDWKGQVMSQGELLLTGTANATKASIPSDVDPVTLEIFNNLFTAVAEQMGITLRNTAQSVNVKERLDFSCALFSPLGDLVVNAPHIPVHLGAMSETIKCILQDLGQLRPGDVIVTNDPYRGGSHLNDITVVSPVHDEAGKLLFFTSSRAHHAEIGGIRPGSMPPRSKNLAEEGVVIRQFKLFDEGTARWDELRSLLTTAAYPSRNPDLNLADIQAQIAANRQGARDLLTMVDRYGVEVVNAYMQHMQVAAERRVRQALSRLPPGVRHFVDYLDDGSRIAVTITIDGDAATIDFAGSAPAHPGNLNANRAITSAAVLYVVRLLIGEEIPLNQGVLNPVKLMIPEGMLNPPKRERPEDCPAVVGGNVETSQRIVDVLLGALGLAAASQGTMNNVLFGDETFGYYETICGGAGATPRAPGADAVHTHMTNTRLTDPEVLETRFPVRVREFSIRRGSGGAGARKGGCGCVRKIEFLAPLELSILSQRRGNYAPYGLADGQPGDLGRNSLERADGRREQLAGAAETKVNAGDVLVIETPGGGGYGPAPPA